MSDIQGHPTAYIAYSGKTFDGKNRVLLSCGHIFDTDYQPRKGDGLNCPVASCSSFSGGVR